MENKNSDFRTFCASDIEQLHNSTDPLEKVHLLRRINVQMFAEACKQNYDDFTICKMLSADLDEYIKESVPVHEAKFNEMMEKLNIQIKPVTVKPTVNPIDLMKSKKCEGTCKNDMLLDDLEQFFNSKEKPTTQSTSKKSNEIINSNGSKSKTTVKMSVDESTGDLVFDTNFRRKVNYNAPDIGKSNQSHQSTSDHRENQAVQPISINNPVVQNYPKTIHENPKLETETSTFDSRSNRNAFNPFNVTKRKSEESTNNFYKRTTYLPKSEPEPMDQNLPERRNDFISASEELTIQNNKKFGASNPPENMQYNTHASGGIKKSLGGRRTINNKYVPPFANQSNNASNPTTDSAMDCAAAHGIDMTHPRLKNVDPKMIETISNEIMDQCDRIEWSSIAGLEYAKKVIMEAVVLPILRPDIFTGLRQPPRGVLLFGPPGTGKTLIGKCIASQSDSTFFSISASSLTSKWIGEGEKMVRALFAVAAAVQPSVVFIDEVDSLLCQRSESEHESSRRLKTEFLVQLDGATTTERERILIIGATNRPQELDEAARRRFVKRLYIPLPELEARKEIILSLLTTANHVLNESHMEEIAHRTDGYSGVRVLCQEAVMGPVRSISLSDMRSVAADSVRPVNFSDFLDALKCVRASVSQGDLKQYIDWNDTYGSGSGK